jgi:AcrR family transcriptional regulator
MTSSPATQRERSLVKREKIVDVAASIFAEQPYDAVSVGEIARRADVAHGLVFYHFKDKRGLYVATITSLLEDLDKFVAPRPGELTGEQIVRGTLGRYFEFIARYPVAMLSLLRVGLHEPDLRGPYVGVREIGLVRILTALGVSCDSANSRLRMALRGWMGYTDGIAADWLDNNQDMPIAECVELSFDALISALDSAEGYRPEPRGTALNISRAG